MRLIMTKRELQQHQNGRAEEAAKGHDDESDYLNLRTDTDGTLFTYVTFRHYDIKVPITVEG